MTHRLAKADVETSSKATKATAVLEQSRGESRNLTMANSLLQSQIRTLQQTLAQLTAGTGMEAMTEELKILREAYRASKEEVDVTLTRNLTAGYGH